MNVKKYNESHSDYEFYNEIAKECTEMINSSFVSGDDKNRTVAYLTREKEAIEETETPTLDQLIAVGTNLSNSNNSVDVFLWTLHVKKYLSENADLEYVTEISKEYTEMINSSYVSGDDKNRTVAYLTMEKERAEEIETPTIDELIKVGTNLSSSNNSVGVFLWTLHVKKYLSENSDLEYATEITKECKDMMNSSYVSGDDKNRTVAYLTMEKERVGETETPTLDTNK